MGPGFKSKKWTMCLISLLVVVICVVVCSLTKTEMPELFWAALASTVPTVVGLYQHAQGKVDAAKVDSEY